MSEIPIQVDRSLPGVRIVTENLPWCSSVALGIWIGVGSADEGDTEQGAAHFLEHVLFKGTPARSGLEISEQIDLVGGDLNAYTGREHTCFHVQVPAHDVAPTIDLLIDVVARGNCEEHDVDIERRVIVDELAARGDDLEDLGCDLVTEAVLGEDPLGRPVIGTEESVSHLDACTLRAFHRRALTCGTIVISAAGRVDHHELVARIRDSPLAEISGAVCPSDPRPAGPWAQEPQLVECDENSEQVQFVLARRTPGLCVDDRAAAQVSAAILGGGLSSRLFQYVREQRGLAYSVYASIDQYRSTGVLTVASACAVDRTEQLSEALGEVIVGMDHHRPDSAELTRAIGHLTGSIQLSLDEPMARMTRLGRHMLDRDRVVPVAESLSRLQRVTTEDVARYWSTEQAPWCLAVLGPDLQSSAGSGAGPLIARLER